MHPHNYWKVRTLWLLQFCKVFLTLYLCIYKYTQIFTWVFMWKKTFFNKICRYYSYNLQIIFFEIYFTNCHLNYQWIQMLYLWNLTVNPNQYLSGVCLPHKCSTQQANFLQKYLKKGRNTKPATKLANQNLSAGVLNRAYFMPMSMRSHSTCQEINIYIQK